MIFRFVVPCLGLLLSLASLRAEENILPDSLAVPAGAEISTYPEPRDDWRSRVQSNFDASRNKTIDLIFDGDSITDRWQSTGQEIWKQRYGSLNVFDFGISGDQTQHVLWRIARGQLDGLDPKLVVLMIGTNNSGRDTPQQIADGVKAIIDEYLKGCPHAHLLLLAIFPRSANAADPVRAKLTATNQLLANFAGDRVTYLDIGAKFLGADGSLSPDIMPDFLHPSAKGYQIWADAIQPIIDQYMGAPAK